MDFLTTKQFNALTELIEATFDLKMAQANWVEPTALEQAEVEKRAAEVRARKLLVLD